jgi:hypothetical protein
MTEPNIKSLAKQLDKLGDRLDAIETRLDTRSAGGSEPGDAVSQSRYCSVPQQPPREFGADVSVNRAAAILTVSKKWVNGTNLHYYLFSSGAYGGDESQQNVVREAFEIWKNLGIGLIFTEVSDISDSELRIGFRRGDGSWSYVGRDNLSIGQSERTMNFGWNINVPGSNGLDTALHEIGHALGFNHEHQNPNAGIVWDKEAVYDYFERTQMPPWDKATTDFNILNKLDPRTVDGSDWDPNSIMHYAFDAGLIREPSQYRNGLNPGLGLSAKDIEVVKHFYPDRSVASVVPELKVAESQRLNIEAGEQKDFNILPTETRTYHIETFGQSDTVIVLFEEENGEFRFVAGDDDSGMIRNSKLEVRLIKDHKYQLRIRLFYSFAVGSAIVMMW